MTTKIRALLSLLDDPNEIVFEAVCSALLREPARVIHILRDAEAQAQNALMLQRLRLIIGRKQFEQLSSLFIDWIEDGGEDLLQGAYLVARLQYPDLELCDVSSNMDRIWTEIKASIGKCQTPKERIATVNDHLFSTLHFRRNVDQPTSHSNNCINNVLELSRGNHITLSVIYSIICQRLGMTVRCVSLPKVMILAYMDEPTDRPLFYINAANNGELLNTDGIDTYMTRHNVDAIEGNRLPCSNIEVADQLLRNMLFSFEMHADNENANRAQRLIDIIEVYSKRKN